MEQSKCDVFISYSRKDYVDEQGNVIPGNEVSKVKDALSEAGITYWFDEEGIYSGQNFVEKIVTNIENSKIFLFLSTVNANKSPWTCKEIASADEFKKYIIPVRLDSSPYNKKVMFRIADLDYIEYFTNPQKGMENLIKSIKTYLDELAAEERKKAEEAIKQKEEKRKKEEELRKQKEEEEKRRQEKMEHLVSEIKLTCIALNNEEAKLEIERENLLKKIETIADKEQQEYLTELLNKSGVVHLKYQKRYETKIEKLTEKCNEYKQIIQDQEKELKILHKEIDEQKSASNHVDYKPTETDLRKWNWGAFILSWVWCIRNRLNWWLIIVCFVLWFTPIVNLISSCILGYVGTKYAWENGQWKDWKYFQTVQKEWKLFGFIFLFGYIVLYMMLLLYK